ncbi:MAG TPA: hypothetical protein VJT73_16575 [Polyangiaceae bacterium]|nr:hypothetical protein [Polyangiaceae bacterium]
MNRIIATTLALSALAASAGITTLGQAEQAPDQAGASTTVIVIDPAVDPFAGPAEVAGVAPYNIIDYHGGKHPRTLLRGATVLVRAKPGLTEEYLQLALNERAKFLATGQSAADGPLAVPGAAVNVDSAGDSFAVTISSDDPKAAREILKRAKALAPGEVVPEP